MFFCAISGSPPTAPVVSRTSGTVYEKALIERYIEENGTDPISGEPLTKEDLIDVKAKPSTLPPRPANQTSIPALLTALQSEYDAIMLGSLEIKREHLSAKQELANSLYREDAATRVIARLVVERDEARAALASLQQTMGFSAAAAPGATEDVEMADKPEGGLPADVEAVFVETNQALSSTRKKRKAPAGYVTADQVRSFTQLNHFPSMHATKPPGISCLDLASDGNTVVTGGPDKVVHVFDLEESKITGTLKGHTKGVTAVAFREKAGESRLVVSGSADKHVRIWREGDKWESAATLPIKKGEISGVAVHPSGAYAAASSTDSTWSLYDLAAGKEVLSYGAVPGVDGSFSYSSFGVHPDGILHGGGTTDGLVRVWDARQSSSLAATLPAFTDTSAAVTTLSFSENGYYLAASASANPTVAVYDLRKLSVLSSWRLPEENQVAEVRFDPYAQFLTVSGTDLRVYQNKTWEELWKWEENAGMLSGARWDAKGGRVVTAGMDRTIRVLGSKA